MRNINKVILIGNVVREPEIKSTVNGQTIASFELATNREWITKDNRKLKSAEFHYLVAWAKLADVVEKYITKGKLLYIEGYLKTRSWEDANGAGKKFRTEIVIEDMIMLDRNHNGETREFASESEGEEMVVTADVDVDLGL